MMKTILMVTSSHDRFEGPDPRPTGVWLEEFAVPYMELLARKIGITVASPRGGAMPVDPRSNPTPEQQQQWQAAIEASRATLPLAGMASENFDAIFLPGGHGPMFDLPDNPDLARLLTEFYKAGKIIAAICHGPAGLVGARRPDGAPLVAGVTLTSYTASEEVAAELDKEVPFILEDRLRALGAHFIARENKADHIERDGQFITGQNPNSSTSIARAIVAALDKALQPEFAAVPRQIAAAQEIATFPVPTFLENIVIGEGGDLFVTSYDDGRLFRISPQGDIAELARLDGNAAGIGFAADGSLLVAGSAGKTQTLYRVGLDGTVECWIEMQEAVFLNGLTHLVGERYLVADSYKSAIWEVDLAARTAALWLSHERLAHAKDPFHPVPMFPGANGLKIHDDTLYVSSTQQQMLLRVPLGVDYSPGELEVFMTNLNLDDFAFDIEGNIFGTTHVYSSVVRISPDRRVSVVAEAEQGLTGSTAVAFGRTVEDHRSLYVTTNGGVSFLSADAVQPGRIVRLDVGIAGYRRP
ncbi:DJ-1/PfpI family protein [Gloeobacter violaceus]|uniref:Glr3809 protein n=1 Tax=Gloeobacter violaceus (strain ATCC 29082 / PCC 7421) TaxID=251221 RepID=Q7NER9_GLOVI|nr:DJ-1/PfpI family protein [Gloeobacter violaceus]BAC91750.1 glr3809 [Gloeobacter violaceus PCC 7421]